MRYLLLSLIFFFIFCNRNYIRKREVDFEVFKKELKKVYGNRNIIFFNIKGNFESYGKTYMKGFFKAILKNDTFKIKIISPPFLIREIEDNYLKEILKDYFNPINFLKMEKIVSITEESALFILRLKSSEIFFEKQTLRIPEIYLEKGYIKFKNFHNDLPLFVEINMFDEKIRLRIDQMELSYE